MATRNPPLPPPLADEAEFDAQAIAAWAMQLRADHGVRTGEVLLRLMAAARDDRDTREFVRLAHAHWVLVRDGAVPAIGPRPPQDRGSATARERSAPRRGIDGRR